jgi:hypothetical protein
MHFSRRRAELVYRGEYAAAGVEPPRMGLGDRILMVAAIRDRAGRPRTFAPPLHLLVADGFEPYDDLPFGLGGEVTDGKTAFWRRHPSARVEGARISHAHCHCVCEREQRDVTEADVILATGELVFPTMVACAVESVDEAVALQPHGPAWLIELQWRTALGRIRAA